MTRSAESRRTALSSPHCAYCNRTFAYGVAAMSPCACTEAEANLEILSHVRAIKAAQRDTAQLERVHADIAATPYASNVRLQCALLTQYAQYGELMRRLICGISVGDRDEIVFDAMLCALRN